MSSAQGRTSAANDLHAHAQELETLSEQLNLVSLARFSQTSFGWRTACLTWLSHRSSLTLGRGDVIPGGKALHYLARHCPLRKLTLDFSDGPEHVDLTAVSLSCPLLEVRHARHPLLLAVASH